MIPTLFLVCIVKFLEIEAKLNETSHGNLTNRSSTLISDRGSSSVGENGIKWYGKEVNIEDLLGCEWPSDFEVRFNFCVNRSMVKVDWHRDGVQFGLLDGNVTTELMEKPDSKVNRTELRKHLDAWWNEIDTIGRFGKCLKKNSEGMVNLCKESDEVSRTVSGIAGLHLGIVDILTETNRVVKEKSPSEACLGMLSEAIHLTGALYLTSQAYAKNAVLCWEVKKGNCDGQCKQFGRVLTCLQSMCPILSPILSNFTLWQWYFTESQKALDSCGIQKDKIQCQSDSNSVVKDQSSPTLSAEIIDKSKALIKEVKVKYNQLEQSIESYTNMNFFHVLLLTGAGLVTFIGTVAVICMWYHGLICGHRPRPKTRRTLRYAKLMADHNDITDERKALTGGRVDDIE